MLTLTQKPLRTLLGFWLLAMLLTWPVGDFPLDDDWSYAEAVKHWVDTGEYWVSDWPAMTLFTQVIWGGLFVKVFGFSFYALRISTLVLAVLGLFAFRQMLVRLQLPNYWQLLATLTLVFNPIYFELSLTFMTDVPFLSLIALSLYAYLRAFEADALKWWAAATLGCTLAILLRQPALLLPAAMGAAAVIARPGWKRLSLALGSTLLVYFSLQGYIFWQEHTPGGLPAAFSKPGKILDMLEPDYLLWKLRSVSGLYLLYIGAMLLPVLLLSRWKPKTRAEWIFALGAAALSLIAVGFSWEQGLLGNTLNHLGLGTIPLPGVHHTGHWAALPQWMALPAKLLGVLGLLLLIGQSSLRLFSLWRQYQQNWRPTAPKLTPSQTFRLGILGFLIPYCFFLLINFVHFDRYLLPVVLGGLLLLQPVGSPRKWLRRASVILLVAMAGFSIAGTHDYFAWNRARWAALHAAMDSGIPPTQIDGGFEFNGWHRTGPLKPKLPYTKSWWFIADDQYAVSFGPFANYQAVAAYPFQRYLPPSTDTVFLLQRPDWQQKDTLFYNMEPDGWPVDTIYAQLRPSEKTKLQPSSYNGSHAYIMRADQAYGLTHRLFPIDHYDELQFSVWADQSTDLPKLVISAPDPDQFYIALQLQPLDSTQHDWQHYEATVRIPPRFPSDTLSFYFWKAPHSRILLDDYQIVWKQTTTH